MGFFANLRSVIQASRQKDPAARSTLEVILAYPGFHAMIFYYMAHALWNWRLRTLARWVSSIGRFMTAIEIHPSARIGRGLFIDHGAGVVIGGTAEVGDGVTLYQGVTLGGTSLDAGKRHPTLEDGVIVGAGAKILGPVTIGRNARIGANAMVVKDVAPNTTMVGTLARPVTRKSTEMDERFVAYGVPTDGLPDPVARSIEGLLEQIHQLTLRVAELEGRLADDGGGDDRGATREQEEEPVPLARRGTDR
jgi:serine O-acetyltransferase